ncbi:MAG TPA: c-type cytochrome [Vicinamibacteria bacterium]|jgi:mono/diheme cytochrome c family protein
MRLLWRLVLLAGLLLGGAACESERRSPVGFRIPEGDVEQGREAVRAMKCHACHEFAGGGFPQPVADPPVPVRLGGQIAFVKTDGELVTSIINPSHRLTYGHLGELTQTAGESRMADYTEIMTVKQLVDIVAFLQSIYEVSPPPRSARPAEPASMQGVALANDRER